jgi:hypothetical protein
MVIPIPGTMRVQRLEENAAAVNVALAPTELDALNAVAKTVQGTRYPQMSWVNRSGRVLQRPASICNLKLDLQGGGGHGSCVGFPRLLAGVAGVFLNNLHNIIKCLREEMVARGGVARGAIRLDPNAPLRPC